MSWTVNVSSPTGAFSHAIVNGVRSDTNEVVAQHIETAIVDPPGNCRELTLLLGRPDLAGITSRSILQYLIGDTPAYWGPAIIHPTTESKGAGQHSSDYAAALERVVVGGGEVLVQESVVGPRLIAGSVWSIPDIAHELCSQYAHPALSIDVGNFTGGTGEDELTVWYTPFQQLDDALDKLIGHSQYGGKWWVDAVGAVNFLLFGAP